VAEHAHASAWSGTYGLPNSSRSPAVARTLVREALAAYPPAVGETASLLVSELVTNVVRHAETELVLRLEASQPALRVTVEDNSPDPLPEQAGPLDPEDDRGRGLLLVAALAASWGWETTALGKRVWFEL
jgi:anti-sigma regulatory factor (Ser/Thr protein kinase)